MSNIKAWYLGLSNATRAGINTAWQSAAGTFLLTLVGWFHDVQEWAGDVENHAFPAVSPLGKAVASAVAGAVAGVLTILYRTIKPGPTYTGAVDPVAKPDKPYDQGDIGVVELLLIAIAIGVAVLVFR